MRIRASTAAVAVGGHLSGPDAEFEGASFDTRTLHPGQLFVPIVADRDGHDFIDVAVAAGAPAYLTDATHQCDEARPGVAGTGGATGIVVDDTAQALLALAAWARRRLEALVVGVTGSVGKTTTKDLIASALAARRRVAANSRSFNNEQGLPVTILEAPDDTEVLVLEMGMRGFGQIGRLCEVARPDIGVVTVVGHSHTELVGGLAGVARAKAELVESLPTSGTAVLNADDERVAAMAARTEASVITFGAESGADVRFSRVELDPRARPRFTIETPWGSRRVELAVSGAHMVSNAAAAIAVAGVAGVDLAAATAALERASISSMRMETATTPSGAVVINDAYNANPTSMRAALAALAAMHATRRVAILGTMAEIDDPARAHRAIAEYAAELGIEVIATGTDRYGVAGTDDPVTALGAIGAGDVVLVKASRSAGLECYVGRLLATGRSEPGG